MIDENISKNTNRTNSSTDFITDERVRLLFMQAPVSNIVVILIALLYYCILQTRLDLQFLRLWVFALMVSALYRMLLWYMRKNNKKVQSSRKWLISYCVGCSFVGISWSIIYPYLYAAHDPLVLAALLMLGFAVTSSAIPILSVSLPAFILYTYPQGLVLAATLLQFDDGAYRALSLGVLIYLIMITIFSRNINRNILRSITLEKENKELIVGLNTEIKQREDLIAHRTFELKEKNKTLMGEVRIREVAEERLNQAITDLDATLLAIPDLLFELDSNGKYINIWTQDEGLLAAQKETLLGTTVDEALPADAAKIVLSSIKEAAEKGASCGQVIKLPLPQGECWFELSTSRKQLSGTDTNFLMLSRDITDKKQMEEELLHANKMKAVGTLAGGIAHDFNNILSAIIGCAEFIHDDASNDSNIRENSYEIIAAANRASNLVKQILTFSRHEVREIQVFEPHLIVKEALKMLRATLPTTVSITESINPDCGRISADPTIFHQIVINLCTNALHAMADQKGSLSVRLYCRTVKVDDLTKTEGVTPGPFVTLTVKDDGCGIDQLTMSRIFEPYFTTKERGRGTGLGLAIIHGAVESYGGFIEVKSVVGKGSTFSVCFPLSEDPVSAPPSPMRKREKIKSNHVRILMVDDEPLLVKINATRLRNRGFHVTAITDSKKALEIFLSQPENFDILITDQTMPLITGAELAKAVLKVKPSLPIIMCTGHSDIVSEEVALRLGIKKYVFKPLHGDELLDAVQEAIE